MNLPEISALRYSTEIQNQDQVIVFPADLLLCIQGYCNGGKFRLSFHPVYYKNENQVSIHNWPTTYDPALYIACNSDHGIYIELTKLMLDDERVDQVWLEDFSTYLKPLCVDDYMVRTEYILTIANYLSISKNEAFELIKKHCVECCKRPKDVVTNYLINEYKKSQLSESDYAQYKSNKELMFTMTHE